MKYIKILTKQNYALFSSAHKLHPEGSLFNRDLKFKHKDYSSNYKMSKEHVAFYDFPLYMLLQRVTGIKKDFENVAFIGTNPLFFIKNLPSFCYLINM